MSETFQSRSGNFCIGVAPGALVVPGPSGPLTVAAPFVRAILRRRDGSYLLDLGAPPYEVTIPADMDDPEGLRAALERIRPVIAQSRFHALQRPLQVLNVAALVGVFLLHNSVALLSIGAWFTIVTALNLATNNRLRAYVPVPRWISIMSLVTLALVWIVVLYKVL